MKDLRKFETKKGHFFIRLIEPDDNSFIQEIIVNTLLEFGASGDGFACNDPETNKMYEAFQSSRHTYYVVVNEANLVLGGGGVAPLRGSSQICEFVKMYFRKEIRGLGLGKALLNICMHDARKMGYQQMYLETLERMDTARGLYEKYGFRQISDPMGETGHYSCDAFYLKDLQDFPIHDSSSGAN